MGTTSPDALPYPEAGVTPFVHLDVKALADAVQAAVATRLKASAPTGQNRVHIETAVTGTTDGSGYATLSHGAPFTPRVCIATVAAHGLHLGYVISHGNITSTTVQVRFGVWNATGTLNGANLNSSVTIVSYE